MTFALVALAVLQPTDFVYVRHAETQANATGVYNERTLNAFSQKGQAQVTALTAELLKTPEFDLILVSPSPRALKTIAPYLQKTGQRAVVWPLLYECCTGRRTTSTPTEFTWGGKFTIDPSIAPRFVVQPGMDRLPVAPGWGPGLAQVAEAVEAFRLEYADQGRVLIVGHSGFGGQFLKSLTGKSYHVKNAEPIPFRVTRASASPRG